ncbi:MAG: MFS transporter, partial [Pseudomonadota bacterium]
MPVEHAIDSPIAGRDVRVLGLVGTGHFFSHFLGIALPPLFPVMQADLSVGYAALGTLLAVANVATMICQLPVGVMVDRFGARRLLALGLGIMSGAIAAIGIVPGYGAVLAMMLLVGVGNSVFHPADYAVLAARISPQRLGRAFSLHTFAGHVGWTVSPLTLAFLTALWSWRLALIVAGTCGLVAAFWIILYGRILDEPAEHHRPTEPARPRAAATPPVRLVT